MWAACPAAFPGKPRQVSRAEAADLRSRDAKPAGPQARQYSATGNSAGQRSDHGRRLADCRRGASREGHGRRSRWSLRPAGQVRHRRRIRRVAVSGLIEAGLAGAGGGGERRRGGGGRARDGTVLRPGGQLRIVDQGADRYTAVLREGQLHRRGRATARLAHLMRPARSSHPLWSQPPGHPAHARRPQGYYSGRSLGRARGRGLPGATVRARIPSVARSALSGITGKMAASFQLCSAADQS